MGRSREYRGYYCSSCNSYSRLYRDDRDGSFRGTCSGCGCRLELPAAYAEECFFFSGGGGKNRGIDQGKAVIVEKVSNGFDDRMPNPR